MILALYFAAINIESTCITYEYLFAAGFSDIFAI